MAANLFKTPLKETRMDVSRGTPELDEGFHWGDYIGEGTVQAIHKGGEGNVIVNELTEIGKGGLRGQQTFCQDGRFVRKTFCQDRLRRFVRTDLP